MKNSKEIIGTHGTCTKIQFQLVQKWIKFNAGNVITYYADEHNRMGCQPIIFIQIYFYNKAVAHSFELLIKKLKGA